MKLKHKYIISAIVLFCFVFFDFSCRKIVDPKVTPFLNVNLATHIFDEIVTINNEGRVVWHDPVQRVIIDDSAIVNYRTDIIPNVLLVDFTAGGIKCPDRKIRKGAVRFDINPLKNNSGFTTGFEDYSVDGNQIFGSVNAVISSNNIEINIDGQIRLRNSKASVYLQAEFTRTLISGNNTPNDINDDVYQITGIATGVTSEGETFRAEITTPLVRSLSSPCRRRFSGGTITIYINNNYLLGTLDYGDGYTCDRKAIVTTEGRTFILDIDPSN